MEDGMEGIDELRCQQLLSAVVSAFHNDGSGGPAWL